MFRIRHAVCLLCCCSALVYVPTLALSTVREVGDEAAAKTLSDFTSIIGDEPVTEAAPSAWPSLNLTSLWQQIWGNGATQPSESSSQSDVYEQQGEPYFVIGTHQPENDGSNLAKKGANVVHVLPYFHSAFYPHHPHGPPHYPPHFPPYPPPYPGGPPHFPGGKPPHYPGGKPHFPPHFPGGPPPFPPPTTPAPATPAQNPYYDYVAQPVSNSVAVAGTASSPQRDQPDTGNNQATEEFIKGLVAALQQVNASVPAANTRLKTGLQNRDSVEVVDTLLDSQEVSDEEQQPISASKPKQNVITIRPHADGTFSVFVLPENDAPKMLLETTTSTTTAKPTKAHRRRHRPTRRSSRRGESTARHNSVKGRPQSKSNAPVRVHRVYLKPIELSELIALNTRSKVRSRS